MAEVKPGRARNARLRYDKRRAAARNTRELLAAAADYWRGAFARLSKTEAEKVCARLVELTDRELEEG